MSRSRFENDFLEIISGRNREWFADLARIVLVICSVPYAVASGFRNSLYHHGLLRPRSVAAPVISVGNLTTGGTGKTPAVAWLVHTLQAAGYSPGIVSRGYGTLDGAENDEKRMLDELCPGVPHEQNRNRWEAANRILERGQANVLVLDDGFQHRRLHRDLDIVLIDALNPWGYNALLPRGLLRETLSGLRRADIVLITRCELSTSEQISEMIDRIRKFSDVPVLRTTFSARRFVNSRGDTLSLSQALDKIGFAFCGIGNADGFRRTLMAQGIGLPEERFLQFPDHHHYSPEDLKRIVHQATLQGSEVLFTTRKDLVKIRQDRLENLPVWALEIELKFIDPPDFLTGLLRTFVPSATAGNHEKQSVSSPGPEQHQA